MILEELDNGNTTTKIDICMVLTQPFIEGSLKIKAT